MMQMTRKSSPLRGLTVLLALMLGAGLALSGCGDDDSTTTTPAPAPAPPAPAPTPTLDAPGGLTVASSGTDYIEFSWEAVEGASGYEIQLSTTEGDFSSVSTASVTATMHRFSVEPGTTAYARVRAVSDEANDSDWTEAVTGMSNAAPLVLGVPTVRVKATGLDFLEWEWDAVDDAQGYQLQVADSEDGLDMAELQTITATSHRVTVEPETTMYIRVRAGVLLPVPTAGDWSAAVMATSDVAPSPLMVSMSPPAADGDRACLGQPFCPDSGKDAKTAMATVNTKMMVTSSHSARITPMFMEGARPVVVSAGSGATPFTFVNWSATQMSVARDGAVFQFEKVTVGAGQETTPTGDVAYITCGPFRCSDAAMEEPAAPAITLADSAACEEFEATLNLVKGMAYNYEARFGNLGVDVGFTYTATHGATVTHEFSDVSFGGGGAYRVRGATISATSTPTALDMAPSGSGNTARNHFGGAANRDAMDSTESQPGPIRNGPDDCLADATSNLTPSYAGANISLGAAAGNTPGKHSLTGTAAFKKPENCVRLITDGVYDDVGLGKRTVRFRNYVSGYRVHINPTASVVWGGSSVSWSSLDDDPFDGLTCPSKTFEVADMLDTCQDFKDEVDLYWGSGIGPGGQFRVEYVGSGNSVANARLTNIVIRNRADVPGGTLTYADAYRPRGARHAYLWLPDTRTTNNYGIDGTEFDNSLYVPGVPPALGAQHAAGTDETDFGAAGNWRPLMSLYMFDGDGDPKYGDFGKTDFQTSGAGYGTADNTDTIDEEERKCSSTDGGAGCDAEMTFDLSVTLTRIRDTDTCTRTIEQSITCTWDADGDRQRGGPGNFDIDSTSPHESHFIECKPA